MTTKYGIRHYPQTGTYLAFKDTVFLGLRTKREWIDMYGHAISSKCRPGLYEFQTRGEAEESIRKYLKIQNHTHNHYIDECVYTKEWWEK